MSEVAAELSGFKKVGHWVGNVSIPDSWTISYIEKTLFQSPYIRMLVSPIVLHGSTTFRPGAGYSTQEDRTMIPDTGLSNFTDHESSFSIPQLGVHGGTMPSIAARA